MDNVVASVIERLSEAAQDDARRTAEEAGLTDLVDFRLEDGGAALSTLADGSVDLLFLDAERTEYPSWWPHPVRVLRAAPALTVTTITVGKGELVALKR